jgi:hypothetical protein
MSMEGVIYVVRLLEITMNDVRVNNCGKIVWPPSVSDQVMPAVDGVLALYDVTDSKSAAGFPGILSKCRNHPRAIIDPPNRIEFILLDHFVLVVQGCLQFPPLLLYPPFL